MSNWSVVSTLLARQNRYTDPVIPSQNVIHILASAGQKSEDKNHILPLLLALSTIWIRALSTRPHPGRILSAVHPPFAIQSPHNPSSQMLPYAERPQEPPSHCLDGQLRGRHRSHSEIQVCLWPEQTDYDAEEDWVITLGYMLSDLNVLVDDPADLPQVYVCFLHDPQGFENCDVRIHFVHLSYDPLRKELFLVPELIMTNRQETEEWWMMTAQGHRLIYSTGLHQRPIAGYDAFDKVLLSLTGVLSDSDWDGQLKLLPLRRRGDQFLQAINDILRLDVGLTECPTVRVKFPGNPDYVEHQTAPLLGQHTKVEFLKWTHISGCQILILVPIALIITEETRKIYNIDEFGGAIQLGHTLRIRHH
ncbi:hypothetical protein C8J56DRAFT_1049072 [Mycena floridula]|nr:hypothetical protein C8J56DRAFT_1049072 [Mycena floridula]